MWLTHSLASVGAAHFVQWVRVATICGERRVLQGGAGEQRLVERGREVPGRRRGPTRSRTSSRSSRAPAPSRSRARRSPRASRRRRRSRGRWPSRCSTRAAPTRAGSRACRPGPATSPSTYGSTWVARGVTTTRPLEVAALDRRERCHHLRQRGDRASRRRSPRGEDAAAAGVDRDERAARAPSSWCVPLLGRGHGGTRHRRARAATNARARLRRPGMRRLCQRLRSMRRSRCRRSTVPRGCYGEPGRRRPAQQPASLWTSPSESSRVDLLAVGHGELARDPELVHLARIICRGGRPRRCQRSGRTAARR